MLRACQLCTAVALLVALRVDYSSALGIDSAADPEDDVDSQQLIEPDSQSGLELLELDAELIGPDLDHWNAPDSETPGWEDLLGGDSDVATAVQTDDSQFTMAMGAIKLDKLYVSEQAVNKITKALTSHDDDLVAFMETDTHCNENYALWSRLRSRMDEELYDPQTNKSMCTHTKGGHWYSLSIFAQRSALVKLQIEENTDVCCEEAAGNKAVLLRSVRVGTDGMLLVIGLSLSAKDTSKARQLHSLEAEIAIRRAAAAKEGRVLHTVTAGDANTRIVLPWSWDTKLGQGPSKKNFERFVTTRRLTDTSLNQLAEYLIDPQKRKQLLDWEAPRFNGLAVGNVSVRPLPEIQDLYSNTFLFMTDWWRDVGRAPEMITYKRTPWFQQVQKPFLQWLKHNIKIADNPIYNQDGMPEKLTGQKWKGKCVMTGKELMTKLQKYLKAECLKKTIEQNRTKSKLSSCEQEHKSDFHELRMLYDLGNVKADAIAGRSEDAAHRMKKVLRQTFFEMMDRKPKVDKYSQHVQEYLNFDTQGNPIYVQAGWLDVVGVGRDGFYSADFLDFKNHLDVWAFDHTLVVGRLAFRVSEPKAAVAPDVPTVTVPPLGQVEAPDSPRATTSVDGDDDTADSSTPVPTDHVYLKDYLLTLTLKALKDMARLYNATDAEVEAIDETDDPKTAAITLVTNSLGEDADAAMNPAYHDDKTKALTAVVAATAVVKGIRHGLTYEQVDLLFDAVDVRGTGIITREDWRELFRKEATVENLEESERRGQSSEGQSGKETKE